MTLLRPPAWSVPDAVQIAYTREPRPSVLTAAERARAASFGHAGRRRQFVLGRTAARLLAAERLGLEPGDVPLAVGSDGAPELGPLAVSIAHGGAPVLGIAAIANGPIGVDVEAVRPRRPDLWTRILRADEQDVFRALGGATDDAQTRMWTMKEAVLKAQRTGFRAGAQSVRLQLDGDRATATSEAGAWEVRSLRLDGSWISLAWAT